MPFRSKKQRAYLWRNKPGLARKWTRRYGSKIKGGPTKKAAAKGGRKSRRGKSKK